MDILFRGWNRSLVLLLLLVVLVFGLGCRTSRPGDGSGWVLNGVQGVAGEAILFVPGIVSTEAFELNATFSPDGNEFFFTRANDTWSEMTILVSHWNGRSWTRPKSLPFNGDFQNADPSFSPDGKRLFFASKRDPLGRIKQDFDLWYVDRTADEWGVPTPLTELNSMDEEVCPFPMADGSLYFTSKRRDGVGKYDVYYSRWVDGSYRPPLLLDPPVNSRLTEVDATLSADGNLLFFAGHGRADSFGKGDIYVCFKRNGAWSSPVNLGEPVNSTEMELCPKLAPDGHTLFFASTRKVAGGDDGGGSADIYLVDLATLPLMQEHGWQLLSMASGR